MSSIAHCPRCDERVRVPQVDGPAEVRCPWCGAEFELDEITRSLPPLLEVISVMGGHYQSIGSPAFESDLDQDELQLADEDRFEDNLTDNSTGPSPAPFPSTPDFSTGERMSPSVTSRPRTRRRKESPFVSFLKMAGGGVAGIFIALLILQALGKVPDLGFWPFAGPNTKLFPTDLFSSQSANDSGNARSNTDANRAANDSNPSSDSQAIDLGVPDFAQIATESSATDNPTNAEPATTESPQPDTIDQLSESLNNYIRSSGQKPDETADNLNRMLATLSDELVFRDEETDKQAKRLDGFVDRLKYETKILKGMLEKSAASVGKLYSADLNEETDLPMSLALIGQVKEVEGGLALKTSADNMLPLELEKTFEDIKKDAIILVIGDIFEGGDNASITINYAKSLKKD